MIDILVKLIDNDSSSLCYLIIIIIIIIIYLSDTCKIKPLGQTGPMSH